MKNIKKNSNIKIAFLAATAILAACSSVVPTRSGPTARPSKYANMTSQPSQYGDWYIEPRTCTIRARAQDFTLVTDGIPSQNTIRLKALFISPLVQPPHGEVSELLAPIPVEGSKRGYSLILAYDATNAAHMMKDDTFLMVRYQPITSAEVLESSFQTRGLMFALADLAKYCDQ